MEFAVSKRLLRRLAVAALLACSQLSQAAVDSVFIQSRLDYNAILISGVDIIFIYDETLLAEFPSSKSEWFSGKSRFLEQAGAGADVVSVFIPQGFDSEMASLPERRNEAVKVFVFAEHDASGRAPIDITDYSDALVEIDQFGILVSRR